MAKLDSKKIDGLLKQFENMGKGAVRALNEMTDNEFAGSAFEKDPVGNIGFIAATLQQAQEKAKGDAKFDGLDDDAIAELLATEREAERIALQTSIQEKLAKRQPEPVAVVDEEPESDPNADPAS